jgi:hypothetical protein
MTVDDVDDRFELVESTRRGTVGLDIRVYMKLPEPTYVVTMSRIQPFHQESGKTHSTSLALVSAPLHSSCSGRCCCFPSQCWFLLVSSGSKIHHQGILLPQSIGSLAQPPGTLRRKFHVEIVNHTSEDQSHLSICQTAGPVSITLRAFRFHMKADNGAC